MKRLWIRFLSWMAFGVDTTATTLAEAVPTIVTAALLELDEGNIVAPLVTDKPFPGAGLIDQTPFINRLTAGADDSPTAEALEASTNDETSPSAATVGAHSAYVLLKDLAQLATLDDMANIAGQLIGQSLVVRRDLDLVTLFTSLTTDQGSSTSAAMAPADLYDAYGSLRKYHAPLPYHLVLHPEQIWASNMLIQLFDNSSDAIQSAGLGTVGEDFARYGFAGMAMGFNIWADSNIVLNTGAGSGAAFSRGVIKNVRKRDFMIEVQRDAATISTKIVGSEMRGEAILRNKHGNEMQFPRWS